jgi:hypothetical protein
LWNVLETVLQDIRKMILILPVHIKTLKIRLFLFLNFFMGLLVKFSFVFCFFGMVIIFFRRELIFGNFIGSGLRNAFIAGPGGIFAVLFTFGMRVLTRIFRFKEEIFITLVLGYGNLLFRIRCKVGTALARVGGIPQFIFRSVVHERIKKKECVIFSAI